MTRQELITGLMEWNPPERWDQKTFRRRDELRFALWWYGESTEADKPNPSWPDENYVHDKTGSGPMYLFCVDHALLLIPETWAWSIQRSDSTGSEVWLYPPDNRCDEHVYISHPTSMPIAICVAAISARIGWLRINPTNPEAIEHGAESTNLEAR
jgi:hypothetical protein